MMKSALIHRWTYTLLGCFIVIPGSNYYGVLSLLQV